jgi:hypothetical protein
VYSIILKLTVLVLTICVNIHLQYFKVPSTLVMEIISDLFFVYRLSSNYRIPSSGLSRGHPVDQVKMFKKIAVTLKKISNLPIFVQKYLINILAMLYFPFE